MRGARIQHLLEKAGVAVDRSGTNGRLVEVYPAAAPRRWGLSSTKYKRSANADACRTPAFELAAGCGTLSAAAATCLDGCDDDRLDDFVCAIVTNASLSGSQTRSTACRDKVCKKE